MIFNFNNLIYLLFLHLLIIDLFISLCKYLLVVPLNVLLIMLLNVLLTVFRIVGLNVGLTVGLVLFLLYLKFTIYYF